MIIKNVILAKMQPDISNTFENSVALLHQLQLKELRTSEVEAPAGASTAR